jgi:putative ABC transport system ATP-binding protein
VGVSGRRRGRRRLGLSVVAGGVALSADAVFALRDVVKNYSAGGTSFRLRIPHLEIERGAKLAFIGESGSGKSTLLEILAMLLQHTSAQQFHFAPLANEPTQDVAALWRTRELDCLSELRSRHIGYVLQSGGLLPYLSVRENIELSRRLLQYPVGDEADQLAAKLDIAQQLEKLPAELSVGQRQRAAIARALAHAPPIVIADEPTAAIDPVNARRIVELLAALTEELGVTLIVATHAQELMRQMGIATVVHEIESAAENTMSVRVAN